MILKRVATLDKRVYRSGRRQGKGERARCEAILALLAIPCYACVHTRVTGEPSPSMKPFASVPRSVHHATEPAEITVVLSATVHAAKTPSSTVAWQSPAGYTVASHVALPPSPKRGCAFTKEYKQ